MTLILSWIQTFCVPCVVSLGSLGLMLCSLWRSSMVSTGAVILGLLALIAQAYVPSELYIAPSQDLITQGWIQGIQTILLWGWVIYALLLRSWGVASRSSSLTSDVWILLILSLGGMLWCVHAHTFLTLFLSLEMMTLPLYITTGAFRNLDTTSEAALKYFVLGSLGSVFFLFGASLIYGTTASLDLMVWLHNTPLGECCCDQAIPLFWIGSIGVVAGILLKISIVPFHMWTPDVYAGVPLSLTSFYTLFPKIAVAGVMTRLCADMGFDVQESFQPLLLILGGISVIVGALGTLRQTHLGRLMGYSSILNSGFLLWGIVLPHGAMPVLTFLMGYSLSLLGVLALLARWKFPSSLQAFQGISRHDKIGALWFTLFVASWIGLPPLAGFWGKFQILSVLMAHHHVIWAIVGMIGSVIASYYGLRLLQAVWFDPPHKKAPVLHRSTVTSWVIGFLVILTLGFGVFLAIWDPWMQNTIHALSHSR